MHRFRSDSLNGTVFSSFIRPIQELRFHRSPNVNPLRILELSTSNTNTKAFFLTKYTRFARTLAITSRAKRPPLCSVLGVLGVPAANTITLVQR